MPTESKRTTRLNLRLSAELKKLIEEAAILMGQSLKSFAACTLTQEAQRIIHQEKVTKLTNRDRDFFLGLINDEGAKPNKALIKAA